jgi:hypothetical protein
MKKKVLIPVISCIVVFVIAGVLIYKTENKKSSPIQRYVEKNSTESESSSSDGSSSDGSSSDGSSSENVSTINKPSADGTISFEWNDPATGNFECTFYSYDTIKGEDINSQSKYPYENFYITQENYDDSEGLLSSLHFDYFDTDSFAENEPELFQEYCEKLQDYDNYDANFKFIENCKEKYTTGYDYDVLYLFVKCKFKNLSAGSKELYVNELKPIIKYDDGTYATWVFEPEYVDNPQTHEGDDDGKSLYEYTLASGEEVECTLGYILYNYSSSDTSTPNVENVYFGIMEDDLYVDYTSGNSEYGPEMGSWMLKITDLKESD